MNTTVLLDPARLDRPDTDVRQCPFPFMIAHGQLPDEARNDLERDFPKYTSAGFFPYDPADCGPSVNALVQQLTTPEFASAIGRYLGIENLGRYPTLITLCPSQTPLAELSTVNLAIDVHEDTEIYTPLTSRIAHLVVIDVLAMGVA